MRFSSNDSANKQVSNRAWRPVLYFSSTGHCLAVNFPRALDDFFFGVGRKCPVADAAAPAIAAGVKGMKQLIND